MNCTRCGRTVANPVMRDGQPFGSTCARIVAREAAKPAEPNPLQVEMFASRWQRVKARVLGVLGAWCDDPWMLP